MIWFGVIIIALIFGFGLTIIGKLEYLNGLYQVNEDLRERLKEIRDEVTKPVDCDYVFGDEPKPSEKPVEAKPERVQSSYFDSNNQSREHLLVFDKQGKFIGVRAIGHPDTDSKFYNLRWPNGDEVECLTN